MCQESPVLKRWVRTFVPWVGRWEVRQTDGKHGRNFHSCHWYAGKIAKWPQVCATGSLTWEGWWVLWREGRNELGGWILCQSPVNAGMGWSEVGCPTYSTTPVFRSCLSVVGRWCCDFCRWFAALLSPGLLQGVSRCYGSPSTSDLVLILLEKNLCAFMGLVALELVQVSSVLDCK